MSSGGSFADDPVVDPRTMTDRELLIRMDGRLGTAIATLSQSNSGVVSTQLDHETRLRAVEKKLWLLAGAAAVVGSVGGNLFKVLNP
jgi:hypothetical protein